MPAAAYLPNGLPVPVPDAGLGAAYFEGLQREVLRLPQCGVCCAFQWPPAWVCHACHAFDLVWTAVEPKGVIYSWTRSWRAVHPALKDAVPYLSVVVEVDGVAGVRLVGNLLGDPLQPMEIGARVHGRFEHHPQSTPTLSLLQWMAVGAARPESSQGPRPI